MMATIECEASFTKIDYDGRQDDRHGCILGMHRQYEILALNCSETIEGQVNLSQNRECTDTMRYSRSAIRKSI